MKIKTLSFSVMALALSSQASAALVQIGFDSIGSNDTSYQESSITFSPTVGGCIDSAVCFDQAMTVSSTTPFNYLEFNVIESGFESFSIGYTINDIFYTWSLGDGSLVAKSFNDTLSLVFIPGDEQQGADLPYIAIDNVKIGSRTPNQIPEPSSLVLAAAGLAGLTWRLRRKTT